MPHSIVVMIYIYLLVPLHSTSNPHMSYPFPERDRVMSLTGYMFNAGMLTTPGYHVLFFRDRILFFRDLVRQ